MAKNITKINLMPEEFKNRFSYSRTITKIITSAVVLGLVLVSYFALIGYKISLNNQIQKIETETKAIKTQINDLLKGQNNGLDKELALMNLIKKIFLGHIYWTNFFQSFEENTMPLVQFSNFSGNVEDKTVTMKGQTASYTTLAQQMAVFNQKQDLFPEAVFSNISQARQGSIGFDLKLVLSNNLLHNEY